MFPSVTTILAPWSDFDRVPADVLAAAAERGRIVHRVCSAHATGLWAPPVPIEYAGYIESFKRWLHSSVERVILAEAAFSHPVYGYSGHPDLIVQMKGDKGFTLVDEKTPVAKSKAWRLQLAGYKELSDVNGYPIERVMSLRLREDGSAPLANEYTGTLVADFATFLSCLQAWKFFKGDSYVNKHN